MEVQSLSPETIQDTFISPSANPTTPTPIPSSLIDSTFSRTTNLTTTVLNSTVLSFSDEFFASASNLLTPTPAIHRPGYYVETGAWYDGWETRRHNSKVYDWEVVKLGCVGLIDGVEIDTAFFSGNHAEYAGVDGCFAPEGEGKSSDQEIGDENFSGWEVAMSQQHCGPSQRQAWKLPTPPSKTSRTQYTHLRLRMYPDGGIARFRVYGQVVPPPPPTSTSSTIPEVEDLASALNGGLAISCSDQHFGVTSNLLLPGRGKDMGDGWETSRSRVPGHVDWVIIRLGLKGKSIGKVVVDTKDFKGNFPQRVRVEGFMGDAKTTEEEPEADTSGWVPLLSADQPCKAHTEHIFEGSPQLSVPPLPEGKMWTHVKMTILPDGGVKRLRIFGERA